MRKTPVTNMSDTDTPKSAEDDSAERLRSILETVPDALIVIDDRGAIETFSPAAERLFGWSAAEVTGKNISMLMPAPYRQQHDGYIDRYQRTGERRISASAASLLGSDATARLSQWSWRWAN